MNNIINPNFMRLDHLLDLGKSFELHFDQSGYLRTLTTKTNGCPFLLAPSLGKHTLDKQTALTLATQFIALPIIKEAFKTNSFNMKVCEIKPFAFGYRITFQQMANYKDLALPIRGGALHIAMNTKGNIFSVSSTLQRGKLASLSQESINESKAISIALSKCKKATKSSHAKLMLACHKDEIQPLYEIELKGESRYQQYTYLILANTGEIIDEFSERLCYLKSSNAIGIKAHAVLITPDPNISVSEQTSIITINDLPDSQILKSAYFEMFTGAFAKTVLAKADNTYCYGISKPEFAAVSVFLSLQKQMELYLSLGLRLPEQPMFVVVNDPFLRDNAYFDPEHYEIHIGMGSGVNHAGLTKHIAFDLGVSNHEFGHAAVFLQVPGGTLIGELGEAINEAIGDVLGALTMDYLGRIWYAKQTGQSFNAQDLQNDLRIIGKYALPPFGIRSQKSGKRLPNDLTGEPHADGLIIGAALADLLVAIATKGDVLENQIKQFAKMTLMALALLPSYKVNFSDMLQATITADKELFAGQYQSTIEECFATHGIVLDTIKESNRYQTPKYLATGV